jgi:hypothetical protein
MPRQLVLQTLTRLMLGAEGAEGRPQASPLLTIIASGDGDEEARTMREHSFPPLFGGRSTSVQAETRGKREWPLF